MYLAQQAIEQLRAFMHVHGIKQKDLAKKMGVSAAFVSQVLSGKKNITIGTLDAFGSALDVTFEISLVTNVREHPVVRS